MTFMARSLSWGQQMKEAEERLRRACSNLAYEQADESDEEEFDAALEHILGIRDRMTEDRLEAHCAQVRVECAAAIAEAKLNAAEQYKDVVKP
jgi:hypothetical protein